MSEELKELKKELWRTYNVIKQINQVAEERELGDEEKDKLAFLIQQFKSIKLEIKEEEEKTSEKDI